MNALVLCWKVGTSESDMVVESRMSRYSQHKEKYRIKSELSLVHCNEGTSARTRPFSFEDIILRRKYKNAGEIEASLQDSCTMVTNIEASADGLETDVNRHLHSVRGDSRSLSEDVGRVSSRRKEHSTHESDEGKLAKDRSRESRNLETKSNSTLTKNLSRNDTPRGKSDGRVQNRKRSNWSTEDSRNEFGQSHLRDRSRTEMSGEKTNGKSVKEREHRQGTDNDHKRVYSGKKDVDLPKQDHKNEPNKRHLRALSGINKYVNTSRGGSDKESKIKHGSEGKEKIGNPDANKHQSFQKGKKTSHQKFIMKNFGQKGKGQEAENMIKTEAGDLLQFHQGHIKRTLLGDQFYSSEDKFQRSHADTERKRISNNGSNSNQRRYSGSSSGLRGYSPRKRKTEAVAWTPSPPTRSPERRTAGWDHPTTRKEWDISSSVVSDVQSSP